MMRTIATCSGLEGRLTIKIGLEFDRELDEFVVRFAALPLSLNTPVPPSEGIMDAPLTPVENNASMRRP